MKNVKEMYYDAARIAIEFVPIKLPPPPPPFPFAPLSLLLSILSLHSFNLINLLDQQNHGTRSYLKSKCDHFPVVVSLK